MWQCLSPLDQKTLASCCERGVVAWVQGRSGRPLARILSTGSCPCSISSGQRRGATLPSRARSKIQIPGALSVMTTLRPLSECNHPLSAPPRTNKRESGRSCPTIAASVQAATLPGGGHHGTTYVAKKSASVPCHESGGVGGAPMVYLLAILAMAFIQKTAVYAELHLHHSTDTSIL